MRGPMVSPALIESRRATSEKPPAPTLRTVVKPACNVFQALATPLIASLTGITLTEL